MSVSSRSEAQPPGRWARLLPHLEPFIPKSIVCVREGYGRQFFVNDLVAGITVGIIALPLAWRSPSTRA